MEIVFLRDESCQILGSRSYYELRRGSKQLLLKKIFYESSNFLSRGNKNYKSPGCAALSRCSFLAKTTINLLWKCAKNKEIRSNYKRRWNKYNSSNYCNTVFESRKKCDTSTTVFNNDFFFFYCYILIIVRYLVHKFIINTILCHNHIL